jgi:hypothetical protein
VPSFLLLKSNTSAAANPAAKPIFPKFFMGYKFLLKSTKLSHSGFKKNKKKAI